MLRRVILCLYVLSGLARADGKRDEAKAHHDLATVQFERGRFAEAKASFRRAYALAPIPDLLFNIGVCQEKLGERAAAIDSYERYLATGPSATDRADVTARIARMRRELAEEKRRAEQREPAEAAAAPPREDAPVPLHRRWWLWTVVGVVVAGAAVGIGVGVASQQKSEPHFTFPGVTFP